MEWNVRVSGARNPDVIEKINAVFDELLGERRLRPLRSRAVPEPRPTGHDGPAIGSACLSPIEIRPRTLPGATARADRALARGRDITAICSSRRPARARRSWPRSTTPGFAATLPRSRLLFVAHREEILDQSRATFRHALRDPTFGERWVGGERPEAFEHVFASIQSLAAAGLDHLPPDHFDIVIVDEFHHAAASSYNRLLEHLEPRELLGLTATPERADGLPILQWFDDRIAAELRLWDAIEQHRLAPFAYYGIHDGLDLREVPWRRGRGYDVDRL